MQEIISELNQADSQTLIIIGNGFDLGHNIKSRYTDFKDWLLLRCKSDRIVTLMETFFGDGKNMWNNIEVALGKYKEQDIFDYCETDEQPDYDHFTRSIIAEEDAIDFIFKDNLNKFIDYFSIWVNQINIKDAKRICDLSMRCKYLTFNYTETLEKIYSIPNANILHIHGSRLSDKRYIIGHNNRRNADDAYNLDKLMEFQQRICREIISCMNNLYKDTQLIINQNQAFFNSISNIKKVIVYGHSFGNIDMPYFREILKHIRTDANWYITYHEDQEESRINSSARTLKIKNFKLIEA